MRNIKEVLSNLELTLKGGNPNILGILAVYFLACAGTDSVWLQKHVWAYLLTVVTWSWTSNCMITD